MASSTQLTPSTTLEIYTSEDAGSTNRVVEEIGFQFLSLMQDGVSSYTSKVTRATLKQLGIDLMEWPPNSPNLNPIDNV